MPDKKIVSAPEVISDEDLDQAAGGAIADVSEVNLGGSLGKDGVLIQNIGFPDDAIPFSLGDKSSVLLNPSRTYKKT